MQEFEPRNPTDTTDLQEELAMPEVVREQFQLWSNLESALWLRDCSIEGAEVTTSQGYLQVAEGTTDNPLTTLRFYPKPPVDEHATAELTLLFSEFHNPGDPRKSARTLKRFVLTDDGLSSAYEAIDWRDVAPEAEAAIRDGNVHELDDVLAGEALPVGGLTKDALQALQTTYDLLSERLVMDLPTADEPDHEAMSYRATTQKSQRLLGSVALYRLTHRNVA